ncbi:HepT-like ribonuclease domain-containing protein [Desulfamplus magnetovallimortis]|uniref:HepT-like ribonuclease domain-containing protein n=1 Tax=Desulfamplus magnetovallimortis TaxID=1246637 RepID=UPI0016458009|nr:nucleotidyltransferase [Desulfamplus magnetovallimortis]
MKSALNALNKIINYFSGYDNADGFYHNQRDFNASMMNFIVIGEMVSRLSDGTVDKYKNVDWYKIRGFRNIIAHNYFGIDAEEVWDIIQNHLPELQIELQKMITSKECVSEESSELDRWR